MSNNKQSSVEMLFEKLWDTPKDKFIWNAILNHMKDVHRTEIIESYASGSNDRLKNTINTNYYNETFGGKNEQQ
jgi:hypothetical protein